MLPMYKDAQVYHCDVSLDIYNRIVSLPCSTSITNDEIKRVIDVLNLI